MSFNEHNPKVQVTVLISQEAAKGLHGIGLESEDLKELRQTADELGIELVPLHEGASDSTLIPFFQAELPDRGEAEAMIDRLRRCRAVDGAYLKPPGESPG